MNSGIDIHARVYTSVFRQGYRKHSLHDKIGDCLVITELFLQHLASTKTIFRTSSKWDFKKRGFYTIFILHKLVFRISQKLKICTYLGSSQIIKILHSRIVCFGPISI